MKELILFRGLPGAGKSTLANALCDVCFSADDFFTDAEGAYHFHISETRYRSRRIQTCHGGESEQSTKPKGAYGLHKRRFACTDTEPNRPSKGTVP